MSFRDSFHNFWISWNAFFLPIFRYENLAACWFNDFSYYESSNYDADNTRKPKNCSLSYREGAFGLGAGKWHVIKTVVIPQCVDGIITGSILSVGKILGESAALLFTAGFAHALNNFVEALTASGATLTVALYVYAKEQGEFEISFAIAAILLIMTFIINTLATVLGKRMKRNKH